MDETSKKKKKKGATPSHMKYVTKPTRHMLAAVDNKPKPSTLLAELAGGPASLAPQIPKIIEFFNMEDNTTQTESIVDINVPLFQPFPAQVLFKDYDAFGVVTQEIFFRNNDNVCRRIKVLQPDSPYFEVSAARDPKGEELKQSTVGAGMEVVFTVKFKPQEVREYKVELVCRTEREKFIIPVYAMGPRAVLDFPDDITFPATAVKNTMEKTLIVRNVGTCEAHFSLTTSDDSVFGASPADGLVEVGQTVMVTLTFTPKSVSDFTGELMIQYHGTDMTSYVSLQGTAENVEVFLSAPSVNLEPAYISLSSQKTVKVCNKSEIPVRFDWRAFHTPEEEEEERSRLLLELEQMQQLEEDKLNEEFDLDNHEPSNPEDSDGSLSGDEGMVPPAVRAARAALRQKYRHLKHALMEDDMQFTHDNYEIKPMSGEIWANSEIEVTVTFRPDVSAEYKSTAYLDVIGRDQRLPLWINSTGVGPKAGLTFDSLDLGDLFINSMHRYELTIENRGDIACDWELVTPDTPFADIFSFSETSGSLSVDASKTLSIALCSTAKLGEFDELFEFKLHGSDERLKCRFKGNIIGPTFHFDVDTIDFGLISYEFLHTKNIMLYNTSEIPMNYSLCVPQDGAFVKKEFSIEPSSGTLEPGQQQQVQVDLISTTVKEYEYSLRVDVEGVGENLLSLPIIAECKVPKIVIKNKEVPYGDCFIRFPYTEELILVNDDPDLSAKYEVIAQDPATTAIASYETIPPVGSVPPNSETKVKIRAIGEKLGNFRLPLMLSIAGSVEPPLQSSIVANCIGPKLSLSHTQIKWGPTTCLIDNVRDLIMTNDSEIPAPFKIFLKNARSKFRVDVRDGVLSPRESVVIHVIACLDDTIVHKDQLHVIVSEGDNLMVPLSAKGMGTTLWAHEDLSVIDFGSTFTNQQCQKYITIENKGRRPQSLKWINQTIKDRILSQAGKKNKPEDGKKKKKKSESLDPVFTINPSEIELPPRTHIRFNLMGFTKHKGLVSERLILETKVLKDKQARVVFDTEIKADFINPLLDLSMASLHYNYTWEKNVALKTITQPLTMTNRTPLPLDFVLKAQVPFSVDVWEHSLAPQESTTINVDFDPGYKADRQSHIADNNLTAVYRGHPQRDNIKMIGDINFPNLDFEYTVINFGCVLNDTTKTMLVKVTNVSKVDTAFSWSFVEDEETAKSAATARKPYIPVNQVFDILPIRSYLKPGESEDIEFVYYGHNNRRFKGLTVCEVEGGPEYEITLLGEASQVGFKLDRSLLDFGKVLHTKSEEREFHVINTGKVAFNYTISTKLVSRPELFEISAPSGKVFPHEKQKIVVKFRPGLPEKVFEKLVLEIAHFDPVEFPVYGEGIYCQLHVTLPRDEILNPWGLPLSSGLPSWPEMLEEARCNLVDPDPKLVVPEDQTLPPPPNATSNVPSNLVPPATASSIGSRPMTGMTNALSSPGSTSSFGESRPGTRGTLPDTSRPGSTNPFPILDAYPTFEAGDFAVKDPTPQEIEMEANRLIFMKHLSGATAKSPPVDAAGNASAPAVISEEKKDDTVANVPASRASTANSKKDKKKKGDDFIIARHVSDFGHVVLGQTRKRTFKITNTSALGQLSWVFDKNLLAGTGFSLEPEKVVRLPENQSVSFNVTFAAKKNFALGEREVVVPLEVKNGPSMVIILRANVTVPELTVSQDSVDFGAVWIGQSKRVYIQLKNISPVNADWDFKKAMGNIKDELKFRIEPRGGMLAPGQCTNVSVEFLPADERPHALKLPLKVASGNKAKNILLTGLGQQVHLTLSPSLAEFGPILPRTPGGISQVITLTNESDKAVEVYSVDFDTNYLEEENILMKASGYGEDGVMQLPVRSPGVPLPPHIMDENAKFVAKEQRQQKRDEAAKQAQLAAEAAAADGGDPEEKSTDTTPPPVESDEEEEEEDDFGLVPATPRWDMAPTARSEKKATDFIFVGPPLSGKSTIAAKLSKQFSYPIVTIDDTVDMLALKKSDLGRKVRASLGRQTASEEKSFSKRFAELEAAIEAEKEEKAAAAAATKGKKKGKDDAVEEEASPLELELKELKEPTGPNSALIGEVLKWRIDSLDCGFGSIMDGLQSKYVSVPQAATIMKDIMPDATMVEFTLNQEEYSKKMESLFLEATEDIGELEEEYAELPMDENNVDVDGGADLAPVTPVKGSRNRNAVPATPMTNMTELPVSDEDIENFVELDDMDLFMLTEQAKRHYWATREANRSWRYKRAVGLVERLKFVWDTEGGVLGGEPVAPPEGDEGEEKKAEEVKAEGDGEKKTEQEPEQEPEPAVTYFSYLKDSETFKAIFKIEQEQVEIDATEETKVEETVEESKTENVEGSGADVEADADAGAVDESKPLSAPPAQPVGLLEFTQEEASAPADVTFDTILAALPKPLIEPPAPGALLIPNPTIRQIVKRPYPRMELTPVFTEAKGFEIIPFVEEEEPTETPPVKDGAEPTNASPLGRDTRWVIEGKSSVKFVVKFHSEEIIRLDSALNFEVVDGGARPFILPCVGHCEVPTINADPRNVFMNRVKTRLETAPPVSKRFVMSREIYEFGPLLSWKEDSLREPAKEDADEKTQALVSMALDTNSENFRISNNGSFPAVIDFLFDSGRAEEPNDSVGKFFVDPAHVELAEGDTADVRVWAFPSEVNKLYEDSLVATLKDSPFETKFDISALGAAPTLAITGQWTDEAKLLEVQAEELIPPVVEEVDEEGNVIEPPPVDAALQAQKDELLGEAKNIRDAPLIDFDRLLLNRSEEKTLILTNNGVVPLVWKVDASDFDDMDEFRISPTEGELMPGENARVIVGFSAIEEKELAPSVTIHWSDAEGGFESENESRCYSTAIAIKAEAYSIKAVAFEEDQESNDGVIDYGQLRVGDTASHKFSLRNRGKYEISYDFSFKRPGISANFTIEPANGKIEPGAAAEVTLTFTSLQEVTLRNNRDIKCVVSEPHTGEAVENFTVSVSVTSHFSRLRLQPARGLNFGAIKYNEEPKVRRFELKNEGLFEFTFTVTGQEVDDASMGAIVAATPEGLRAEGAVVGGAVPEGEKEIGQFVVTPSGGVLQPGQSTGVEVKFVPNGSEVYREDLKILISGCEESDSNVTNAALYECIGESCFPGVVVNDFRSIFEEQTVIGSMSELGEVGINNKATSKTAGNSNAIGKAVFAEEDVLFNYGNVISSTSEADKGTVEKFKITNPTKVNSVVSFELGDSSGGDAGDVGSFTVQPASWDIPAHEYRYVSVYFRPKEMKSYRCSFKANVADSHESQDKPTGGTGSKMSFDLCGAGTLPCVNVTMPNSANEKGQLLMPFGSVELGKSRALPIHLSNDGVVPCTVLFEMADSACFSFAKANGSETMEPGEKRQLQVLFKPNKVGEEGAGEELELKMSVMHNSYESETLLLTGTCYSNDALIEDIDDDELKFDEVDLNSGTPSSHVNFTVRSKSDEPLRFEFAAHEHFKFEPSAGHLPAGGRKDIVAKFDTAGDTKTYKSEPVEFSTSKIEYSIGEGEEKQIVEPTVVGWDNSMKEVRVASEEEAQEIAKADASEEVKLPFKVVEVVDGVQMIEIGIEEPTHGVVGDPQVQPLKCTGVADVTKFECETRSIVFKTAAMFQKRVHRFVVSNKGETQLSYNWGLENVPEGMRPVDAARPSRPAVPCPYTIEPSEGAIAGQSEQQFTLTFAPLEVDDFCYVAKCSMPGLVVGDDVEELAISLRAKSSRPIVHIELGDQNDYLSRRRNDLRNELGLFGQIEASSVRVVELESRGTRVRNTKRFHVINPTSNSYEFSWVPMGNPSPAWRCTTSKGMILAGKRGEMVFEYTPDEVGVAESFYKFKIAGTSVDELFLFTGSVVEPVVAFDRQRLDFGAQLLGGVLTDTIHIVNDENLPFSFNFDAMSMGGAGDVFPGFRHPVLELIPMSGLVPPNGRIPIVVNFSPAEEKFHNFNLVCHARKKPNQLNLNVKGEGYAVHTKLLLTEESGGSDGDGEREMVESRRGVNYVDFGHVHLNEKLVKNLSISNTGKFNVDYSWTKSKNNPMLKINGCKSSGSLRKGEKLDLELEFSPVTETSLEGIVLKCTIAGRYDYVFQIGGSGVRPNLHFSFIDFDFGARFITAPGATLEAAESVMLVTNRDLENSLSIDSAFVSQRALRIESKPTVLEPGEALEIPFLFAPREAKDYEFDVPFLVNGTSKQNVKIKGKGVYARLDLVDLHQSHLQFGSIVEGNTVSRNVKVVNKSSAELTFNIVDEDKVGFGKGKLEYNDIIYFPAGPVVLGPHESCVINLTFSPEKRLMNFTEDLLVRYAGETRKLLSMSGAATGFEVMLETDALPFGVVMAGSMRTRKLNFENSGDMPARCKWLEGTFGENFSISPVEANVPPGSEFAFDVCFSPTYIDDDVRQEGIKLLVDGSDPLTLTCTGSCVPQPEDTIKTMSFSSCARKESVQSISISNPTDKVWTLTPVIKGIHWFGMDEISVPGKGSVDYNLTYYPLSMTTAQGGDGDGDGPAGEEKHKGSLFFALPNGSALLYNLEGDSSEPEPESRGSHNTVAKTMLTIPLPVKNWLRSPQKFKVDVTLADEAEGSSTFLEGANQIDVPSMATRDYPLRFFSYKEGLRAAVVKFTNVVTGEYLFHEIAVQVGPSEVQDTFKLEAPVRQVAKKILNIDNPLGSEDAVTFGADWWKCDNECVRLTQIGSMAGSKEGTFEIEYRPLVTTVGVEKASLTFQIEELGDYKFELELLAMPASAQYQLRFECPLGSKQTETFTFKGFNKSGCDFDNTVDKPEFFTVDKSLKAPPSENVWDGQDLRLGVSFEPSSIGEVRDTLRVKSKDYGDYSCTLIGVCTPALPQGPFLLPNGGSKDVEFRNVFGTAMDFSCVTDDPRFTVSAGVVNIPARTSKGVQVKYVKEEGQKGKAKAKLSIRCKDRPDVPAWIFYLTGEEE
ncbi:hypothetical protein TrST_g5240 [Triparma strigata]|uniref:HYDIN/VesB/CFA65-like Ig-like domain-containing protein n=1 Tax=Triparma strigata TaxID=1606541 RepID=A0A9W7E1M3_9STRA|nr:hypothetical protein TrST_g5240 [Triparma strigata]